MVHTFLTHPDFATSARLLNSQRLGKQRVEAYQILLAIQDALTVAAFFGTTLPDDWQLWPAWLRQLAQVYQQLPYLLMRRKFAADDSLNIFEVQPAPLVTPELTAWLKQPEAEWRIIYLRFPLFHPATRMWAGHANALKEYLTVHICEWEQRGYQNNMRKYALTGWPRPAWTYEEQLHCNHRAALLQKELTRAEPAWYQTAEIFWAAGPFLSYYWPLTPAAEQEKAQQALVARQRRLMF